MKFKTSLSISILIMIAALSTGCNSIDSTDNSRPIDTKKASVSAIENTPKPQEISPQVPKEPQGSDTPKVQAQPVKETPKEHPKAPMKIEGLINISDIDDTIVVDLKYATEDNFVGQIIYDFTTCLLREETALKLKAANEELSKDGYRIKIFDGYRPPYAQKVLWNKVPNPRYVANPNKGGSIHSRGAAVDITIIDSSGKELEMPTKYDDLTPAAAPSSKTMSETARKNMLILQKAMTNNGFRTITSEWWHFSDTNSSEYSILEVDPKLFESSQN